MDPWDYRIRCSKCLKLYDPDTELTDCPHVPELIPTRIVTMRFRSKLVEIEAFQYLGPNFVIPEDAASLPELPEAIKWRPGESGNQPCVKTIHGELVGIANGDWIVTEPDGIHHYPVKPDIFDKRWELIENIESQSTETDDRPLRARPADDRLR